MSVTKPMSSWPLLLAIVVSSCAREPSFHKVIILQNQSGLSIAAYGGCMSLTGRAIPSEYTLEREQYRLRLTAFENGGAGLGLEALDRENNELALRTALEFRDSRSFGMHYDVHSGAGRYWVSPEWIDRKPLDFEVVDEAGTALGREQISYLVIYGLCNNKNVAKVTEAPNYIVNLAAGGSGSARTSSADSPAAGYAER